MTAPAKASVRYRKTAKLAYTVRDAFSPSVKVSATVTDAKGADGRDAGARLGQAGRERTTCTWKPQARRTYTVTFRAMDLGGNRQAVAAVTQLRVR